MFAGARSPSEWGSALRIGGSLAALLGCFLVFYHLRGGAEAEPLYLFEAYHIAYLFSASNTAFLSSTLLLLWRMYHDPERGALGISLHAQRLNLAAVLLRCVWVMQGHFSTSWFTCIEATLSVLSTVALAVVIDPQLSARVMSSLPPERRPVCASPEAFPSVTLFGGTVLFALCAAPLHAESLQWVVAAAAIYVEAGAVLPQRASPQDQIVARAHLARVLPSRYRRPARNDHASLLAGNLTVRMACYAGRGAATSNVDRADARRRAAHLAYAWCSHTAPPHLHQHCMHITDCLSPHPAL